MDSVVEVGQARLLGARANRNCLKSKLTAIHREVIDQLQDGKAIEPGPSTCDLELFALA